MPLNAGMWKLSLDVENEPPVKIEPPVFFVPPVLNEPFLRNFTMRFREQRKSFIISLKFRAHLIQDVENEPPVIKEIPPLIKVLLLSIS